MKTAVGFSPPALVFLQNTKAGGEYMNICY